MKLHYTERDSSTSLMDQLNLSGYMLGLDTVSFFNFFVVRPNMFEIKEDHRTVKYFLNIYFVCTVTFLFI